MKFKVGDEVVVVGGSRRYSITVPGTKGTITHLPEGDPVVRVTSIPNSNLQFYIGKEFSLSESSLELDPIMQTDLCKALR